MQKATNKPGYTPHEASAFTNIVFPETLATPRKAMIDGVLSLKVGSIYASAGADMCGR